jgi:bifunctional DNase/RNase
MGKDVVQVTLRAVVPLEGSYAVFLGNDEKTFVIYVDEPVGSAITMSMRGIVKERPLTHDLLGHVLKAFGGRVDHIVINHLENGIFHARIILSAENELQHRKVVELDARPSDSIALAVQHGAKILVSCSVWNTVDDMSDALDQIEKKGRGKADTDEV